MIRRHTIPVTVTGAAGSATGTANSQEPVNGRLLAVNVDYTTQPATCDVTIKALSPDLTFLTLTNANTDAWFYPRVVIDDTAGADAAGNYDAVPIHGYVNVAVAGGDPGSVEVVLLVET